MSALMRLKQRADFLRVAKAQRKRVTPGLILQVAPSLEAEAVVRVGFTVSRRTGNAVRRNRIRRRLRAVAETILPSAVRVGYDFVLIGRIETLERPYRDLLADLERALYSLRVSRMDRMVYIRNKIKSTPSLS